MVCAGGMPPAPSCSPPAPSCSPPAPACSPVLSAPRETAACTRRRDVCCACGCASGGASWPVSSRALSRSTCPLELESTVKVLGRDACRVARFASERALRLARMRGLTCWCGSGAEGRSSSCWWRGSWDTDVSGASSSTPGSGECEPDGCRRDGMCGSRDGCRWGAGRDGRATTGVGRTSSGWLWRLGMNGCAGPCGAVGACARTAACDGGESSADGIEVSAGAADATGVAPEGCLACGAEALVTEWLLLLRARRVGGAVCVKSRSCVAAWPCCAHEARRSMAKKWPWVSPRGSRSKSDMIFTSSSTEMPYSERMNLIAACSSRRPLRRECAGLIRSTSAGNTAYSSGESAEISRKLARASPNGGVRALCCCGVVASVATEPECGSEVKDPEGVRECGMALLLCALQCDGVGKSPCTEPGGGDMTCSRDAAPSRTDASSDTSRSAPGARAAGSRTAATSQPGSGRVSPTPPARGEAAGEGAVTGATSLDMRLRRA